MTREAMVIRPDLGQAEEALARLPGAKHAAEVSRLAAAVRERQIAGRVLRHAAARRALAGAAGATSRAASSGFMGAAAGGATRAALGGAGAVLLGIGALAVIGPHLWQGGSMESLSAELNSLILGEADDDARARGQARDYLTSNRALVAHVGQKGISPALERIMGDLSDRAKVRERGASEILKAKAFASHGPIEQLLQKLKAAFLRGWNGTGGDQELDRVRKRLGRMRTSQIGS